MNPIRIFLIDDHGVLRQGLRLLIEAQADMRVVGEAERGHGAADAIASAGGADVVVLDVSMPDTSGPVVAAELHASLPSTRVVALTRHGEKAYIQQMLNNGASGYVLKQTAAEVLVSAIRAVAQGRTFLDPAVAATMLESANAAHGSGSEAVTPREREVLTMVAYGHTNKEIAAALGITVKTVESHKSNGMQKLGIASRAALVRFALEQRWLERPP